VGGASSDASLALEQWQNAAGETQFPLTPRTPVLPESLRIPKFREGNRDALNLQSPQRFSESWID